MSASCYVVITSIIHCHISVYTCSFYRCIFTTNTYCVSASCHVVITSIIYCHISVYTCSFYRCIFTTNTYCVSASCHVVITSIIHCHTNVSLQLVLIVCLHLLISMPYQQLTSTLVSKLLLFIIGIARAHIQLL